MKTSFVNVIALSVSMFLGTIAQAEDYVISIKNHQFIPRELVVAAGQRAKIMVRNQDATPAEFESSDLNREKVVGANSEIIVFVGPLDPGRYVFFDDFHRETTTGVIIAK